MKKYISTFILPIVSVFTFLLTACSKDNMEEPDPVAGLQLVAEGFASGAATKVKVYSGSPINTGYTPLYISLYDSISNQVVEKASIELFPLMDMVTKKHASPVENPLSENAVNKLFPCNVVFTMPSGELGSWTLGVKVRNRINGKEGMLTIPVNVGEPLYARMRSFTSKASGDKIIVALLQPSQPKVGVNDIELAVYRMASMMSFPADSSMTIQMTPEMPTMGHGSPNNVDPVHVGRGHYKGKVNFTMTGLWQINLVFNYGDTLADNANYFEVNF